MHFSTLMRGAFHLSPPPFPPRVNEGERKYSVEKKLRYSRATASASPRERIIFFFSLSSPSFSHRGQCKGGCRERGPQGAAGVSSVLSLRGFFFFFLSFPLPPSLKSRRNWREKKRSRRTVTTMPDRKWDGFAGYF